MGPHYHPSLEVMFSAEGNSEVLFFDENKSETHHIILTPHTFVIIKPNAIHQLMIPVGTNPRIANIEISLTSEIPDNNKCFSINLDVFQKQCENLTNFINGNTPFIIVLDDGSFYSVFKQYLSSVTIDKHYSESPLETYLSKYQVIVQLSKIIKDNLNKASYGAKYINKAITFIYENFDKKITSEDIAEASGVNKFYLQKLFKRSLNISIIDYLNEFRIKHCVKLLGSSDIPLSKLHEFVGFSSRQALLFNFKKYMGVSPFVFKKNIKEKVVNIDPDKEYRTKVIEIR